MGTFLKPADIPETRAEKILHALNSFESAAQLQDALEKNNSQRTLSARDLQRIFKNRTELGRFWDLNQLALVRGIGAKKLDFLIHSLGDHAS